MMKPTLCLDFDGVLSEYRTGWSGPGVIDDAPTPGAREFVEAAQQRFEVVICSTRAGWPVGKAAIERWLAKHDFPPLPVTAEKPPAVVYIDDRGYRFTGTWPDPEQLASMRPWTEMRTDK